MKNIRNLSLALSLVLLSCKSEMKNPTQENVQPQQLAVVNHQPTAPVQPATIQIALLLDTSGSMNGLINQAKAQLWNLVNKMSYAQCDETQANLEIALYEYGNSALSQQSGYIRQIVPFSTDLDAISKELFALDINGGDEYCGATIAHASQNLEWRDGQKDLKMIFIAGNESFLQGHVPVEKAMGLASEKDITVNTIFCGDAQTGISLKWKDGALKGHGEYTIIDHNQATHYVSTPYDDQILQLNNQLNTTYVAYGTQGREKAQMQLENDMQVSKMSETANVNRSVVKSKSVYYNGDWDLIDAAEDEEMLEELIVANKGTLSDDLQDKSVAEIKEITLHKKKEREQIQQQILELNNKREDYMKSQGDNNNGLENAMIDAIKKRAKGKNYSWDK